MSKRKKMEPAVETLYIRTPTVTGGGSSTFYMDLSQVASIVNRRFYRQGINWAVGGFKITSATPSTIIVQKLPNTWSLAGAWNKAFHAWNDQQMEAIEDMGGESGLAAFRDFKVFADAGHVTAGIANNLLPYDTQSTPAQFTPGEWEASQIVIPNDGAPGNTVEYFVQMVGASTGAAKGAIAGYEFSRAYPQEPDPTTPAMATSWLNRMNDVGDQNDDIVNNAIDRNDNLPYPQAGYPGGGAQAPTMQLHDISTITGTTVGGMTRIKGGSFPCGLVRFDIQNTGETSGYVIVVDLIPGQHRGYLCETMQEM